MKLETKINRAVSEHDKQLRTKLCQTVTNEIYKYSAISEVDGECYYKIKAKNLMNILNKIIIGDELNGKKC